MAKVVVMVTEVETAAVETAEAADSLILSHYTKIMDIMIIEFLQTGQIIWHNDKI
jgi:hypothetical protein